MPINPWLITWDIYNPSNGLPTNLVAAILPNQTARQTVATMMLVFYHNLGDYLSDQLRYATHDRPHKIIGYGPFEDMHIEGSPGLHGRHVWNYVVSRNELTGEETATWEDRNLEIDTKGNLTGCYWLRLKTYDKKRKKIDCADPVRVLHTPKKRRNRSGK